MRWFTKLRPRRNRFDAVPTEALRAILAAGSDGTKGITFHGGCVGCVMRVSGMNRTVEGLRHCEGCMYFAAEWDLPDKGEHIELGFGCHSSASVDAMVEKV